jgi:hypothetical protein
MESQIIQRQVNHQAGVQSGYGFNETAAVVSKAPDTRHHRRLIARSPRELIPT